MTDTGILKRLKARTQLATVPAAVLIAVIGSAVNEKFLAALPSGTANVFAYGRPAVFTGVFFGLAALFAAVFAVSETAALAASLITAPDRATPKVFKSTDTVMLIAAAGISFALSGFYRNAFVPPTEALEAAGNSATNIVSYALVIAGIMMLCCAVYRTIKGITRLYERMDRI